MTEEKDETPAAAVEAAARAYGCAPQNCDGNEAMAIALAAAIPHLHAQPAELAEQQGYDDGTGRIRDWSGKQQAGEVLGDWRAMLSQFGEDDPREGSRSNGHDGVDHNDWVDHAEVPVNVLSRIAAALAASRAEVERQSKVIESYRNQKKILDAAMEKGNV